MGNQEVGWPNLIERIEGALLSYGNDFDNRDNPLEANFDKYTNSSKKIINAAQNLALGKKHQKITPLHMWAGI